MSWKYEQVIVDGKRRLKHRLVMENHLGRKLKSNEVVHHKNGNPKDNRIENLQLTTNSEHTRKHHPKKFVKLKCDYCGKQFLRKRRNRPELRKKCGYKNKYCSRECSGKARKNKSLTEENKKNISKGMKEYWKKQKRS